MCRFRRLVICSVLGIPFSFQLFAQTIQINRENKTTAISTTDEATVTADIAAITIGFEIYGSDAQTVTGDGGKLSHGILDALHKAGVEDQPIESSSQGVERNKDLTRRKSPSNGRGSSLYCDSRGR